MGSNLIRLDLIDISVTNGICMDKILIPERGSTNNTSDVGNMYNLRPIILEHIEIVKLLNKKKLKRLSLTTNMLPPH